MDVWTALFLPFALLLARVGTFIMVLPIFNWQALPMRVRAGMAVVVTAFFAMLVPVRVDAARVDWVGAIVLMVQEMLHGGALGLAASFVFLAVQQGGEIIGMQIGLGDSGIIDPDSGTNSEVVGTFFQIAFAMVFLAADGHHLFLLLIGKSYDVFPVGAQADSAAMASALVQTGSLMLLLGLKLAAPILAAFVVLAVVLAVLARVLPEMNILFTSLPLRVGLGLLMAAMIIPFLDYFSAEVADWMRRLLV